MRPQNAAQSQIKSARLPWKCGRNLEHTSVVARLACQPQSDTKGLQNKSSRIVAHLTLLRRHLGAAAAGRRPQARVTQTLLYVVWAARPLVKAAGNTGLSSR